MQKAGAGRADGSLVAARLWLSSKREGARLVVHLAAEPEEPACLNKLPRLTCFGASGSLSVSLKGLLQGACAAWTNSFALTGASEQKATKMALVITFKLSFCSVTQCTRWGHTCLGREGRKTHRTLPPTTGDKQGYQCINTFCLPKGPPGKAGMSWERALGHHGWLGGLLLWRWSSECSLEGAGLHREDQPTCPVAMLQKYGVYCRGYHWALLAPRALILTTQSSCELQCPVPAAATCPWP